MPEELELDTEKLRETIDAEIDKAGGRLLRIVALATAVIAAITAIVSLHAGATINEALMRQGEATELQARASDAWAYYQAKGIKSAIAATSMSVYASAGHAVPDSFPRLLARYAQEQAAVQANAQKLEGERDARSAQAAGLLEQHHRYALAVALLQVAIALGAVAALTRQRVALGLALVIGALGTVLALAVAVGPR